MTRGEFGLDFFNAIRLIGGILANQDQLNAAVHRAAPLEALKATRTTLSTQLGQALDGITPAEMTEIHERYPIVRTL